MSGTKKRLRFYNPIAGKPTTVNLSGLFLIDPGSIMKLYGYSLRGLFSESVGEKYFKKWERISTGKQTAKPSVLSEMLQIFPPGNALTKEIEAVVAGDGEASQRLNEIGNWEACYLWSEKEGEPLSSRRQFIVDVERASRQPLLLMEYEDFTEAASLLARDELLSSFLWPEAFNLIESAQNLAGLLPLRAAVALEVQLSILAAMDVESNETGSVAACVIPTVAFPGRNPTKLFFEYLLKESGFSAIEGLVNHERLVKQPPEPTTLKRWSAGSHHPNRVWLEPIVEAIWGDANYLPAWNRYWAAKYLNYIGYLGQTVSKRAQMLVGTNKEVLVRPWPKYPFGYTCFEDWVAARYPVWLNYHQSRATFKF